MIKTFPVISNNFGTLHYLSWSLIVPAPLPPPSASRSVTSCDKIFKGKEREREYNIPIFSCRIGYRPSRSNRLLYEPREGD